MEKLTTGPVGIGTRFLAKWKQGPVIETECTRFDDLGCGGTRTGPISLVLTITLDRRRAAAQMTPTANGPQRLVSTRLSRCSSGSCVVLSAVFRERPPRAGGTTRYDRRRGRPGRRLTMNDVTEPIGGQGSRAKTPVTFSMSPASVSLASSAVAAVALVLLVLMYLAFGLGATSAGQTFGGINDALILVAYVLAVPGVLATAEMLRSRRPRLAVVGALVALGAIVAIAVLQWQLVSGALTFEQQFGPVSIAFSPWAPGSCYRRTWAPASSHTASGNSGVGRALRLYVSGPSAILPGWSLLGRTHLAATSRQVRFRHIDKVRRRRWRAPARRSE